MILCNQSNGKGVVAVNKHLQHLLLFETCKLQTKLPKKTVLKRVESFLDPQYTDYYGNVWEDGFYAVEKNRKTYESGQSMNSFAPVATAKVTEENGMTTVSMTIRINLLVMLLLIPLYLIALISIIGIPVILLILHFTFVKPLERMKNAISQLLME